MGQDSVNSVTPISAEALEEDFEIEEQPSKTYKMNVSEGSVRGYTDELEAMRQAVYKILMTERFRHIMYSGNYGIETVDLYGQEVSYVCPELERRIAEALTRDERIDSVDNFSFDTSEKGVVRAFFTVHTVFGDIDTEREVNF